MTFIGANRDAWGYLMDTVTTEHAIERATDKASYYMAEGTPAGIWQGKAAKALGLTTGEVTKEQLQDLFGEARNPKDGTQLGKAFIQSTPLEKRVALRVDAQLTDELQAAVSGAMNNPNETRGIIELHAELREQIEGGRAALTEKIMQEELERKQQQSLAGFEFVFSPPKSVSSWWAIAGPDLKDAIRAAHHAAIAATIEQLETEIIRTRVGVDGAAQQHVQGIIAPTFDHWDSRDGDPQLHTHMLVLNRAQGSDGK